MKNFTNKYICLLFSRFFRCFTVLLLSIFALQACSDVDSTSKKGSHKIAKDVVIPENPEYGGKLILASIGEPSNLIPPLSTDSASHEVSGFLYTSLLEYDKNYNIIPLAAEKYEILEGGRLLKFKLREDILWQDGKELTADDVTFTYNLMIDPDTPTAYAADYLNVAEYKQTGKYSIEVRYDTPYARAPITWMRAILPKHILENENITSTPFARNPIGAGPFKLKKWNSGSSLILEANDTYFKGRPYLDEIIYRIIPDVTTIFLEAKAGQVDYLALTTQQYLRQTEGKEWSENWSKFKYLANGYTYIGFNLSHPFFRNPKIREALSYATDREALIKGALLGLGKPTIGPYKPGSWVYNKNLKPHAYDPEKAKKIFAEEGWRLGNDGILEKDGIRFSFTILVNQGNKERENVVTILQQYWRKIGVEITIRTVEWATFINEFVHNGRFDALILAWNILEDPDIFDVWHSSAIKDKGLNFVGYENKEVDQLLEKARSTTNQDERKKYYDRFQEILHEDQPYLFLYVPYALPMVKKEFQGVELSISGIGHNMDRWWLPKAYQ